MASGIYAIVNTRNGMRYVGQAADIEKRWYEHRYELRKDKHRNAHLQLAWNKYGEKAFEFCVVDTDIEPTRLALTLAEQFWMDTLGRHHGMLYNLAHTAGYSTFLGKQHTNEAKARIRAAATGNQNMAGRCVSAETREKISSAQRGRMLTPEHTAKLRAAGAGFRASHARWHINRNITTPNCALCN